jgi:hypothetical protein
MCRKTQAAILHSLYPLEEVVEKLLYKCFREVFFTIKGYEIIGNWANQTEEELRQCKHLTKETN